MTTIKMTPTTQKSGRAVLAALLLTLGSMPAAAGISEANTLTLLFGGLSRLIGFRRKTRIQMIRERLGIAD